MESSYIGHVSDVMEKLENNSGHKQRAWVDETICGDYLMVRDEHADIVGGRVCQNMYTDSPFSWL